MVRLTCTKTDTLRMCGVHCDGKCNICEHLNKAIVKLKSYEDAEEQGLLLRLPVAEGSTVFVIRYTIECKHNFECPLSYDKYKCEEDIRCEHEYKEYYVREAIFNHAMMKSLGKTVFLTKEEAELKLVEMRGE